MQLAHQLPMQDSVILLNAINSDDSSHAYVIEYSI
jgi:hypothetical protein